VYARLVPQAQVYSATMANNSLDAANTGEMSRNFEKIEH
jgi:hypothetical protein